MRVKEKGKKSSETLQQHVSILASYPMFLTSQRGNKNHVENSAFKATSIQEEEAKGREKRRQTLPILTSSLTIL